MLLNYFYIAVRNLLKYKSFSAINIFGMAISLASCLLIAIFVWDEFQYDRHHLDGDRTFRVYTITVSNGESKYLPIVPYPFATYMQKDFPEIERTARIDGYSYGEKIFEANGEKVLEPYGVFTEAPLFNILSLKILAGDSSGLNRPNHIALSQTLAKKYYGDRNPVGESLKINSEEWQITAVYADPPPHFHLKLNYLLSMVTLGSHVRNENNWQQGRFLTYLKLKPGTDHKSLEAKFRSFVEKYAYPITEPNGVTYVPYLQNLKDIHLHSSQFEGDIAQRGNAGTVYILSGAALLILVIASLNFINLSTARAIKRTKEVGVRKVNGANQKQLIAQFVSESVMFSILGFVLAIGIAQLALPTLNNLLEKQLLVPYSPAYLLGGIVFSIALGILAGSYPALYLSRYRPAVVLARRNGAKNSRSLFRESLIVMQFMLSFFLISASMVILTQNDLLRNKDLGFDKDQLVIVELTPEQLAKQKITKTMYSNHPNVISTTIGFGLPGDIIAGDEVVNPDDGKIHQARLFCVDHDYLKTMGLRLVAGRDFSLDFPSDSAEAFILNEVAVKAYGFGTAEAAIGRRLNWKRWHDQKVKKGRIIGVVEDFNFNSLHEKISPTVLHIYPEAAWKMAVRIKPMGIEETISHLKKTYEKIESSWIFGYYFLDDNFDAMYKSEHQLGILFTIFTYLAIIVACLGLFGLVEYSINQRIKEISVRKVFGATLVSLLVALTKRYFILLTIAFLLIIPFSYYSAEQWLTNFEYRIDLDWTLFLKVAFIILSITIITVSFQSIKAAVRNPADVLRND